MDRGQRDDISRIEFRPTVITSEELRSVTKLLAIVISTDSIYWKEERASSDGNLFILSNFKQETEVTS